MILKELLNRDFEQRMLGWGTTQGWFNLHGLRRKLYTPEHLKADLKLAVEIFSKLETEGLIISSVTQEFYEEMEYEEGDCEVAIPTGKVDVTEYIVLLPPGGCANSCDDIVEYEIGKDGNITREPIRHVCDILYAMMYRKDKNRFFLSLMKLRSKTKQVDELERYLDVGNACAGLAAENDPQAVNNSQDTDNAISQQGNMEEVSSPCEKDLYWIKGDTYEEKQRNFNKIIENTIVWKEDYKKQYARKYVSLVLDKIKTQHVKGTKLIVAKPEFKVFNRLFEGVFKVGVSTYKKWDIYS